MKNKNLIIAAVLVVAALSGGFFGGMQYQKGQTVSNRAGGQGGRFGGANGVNSGARPVRGQILSVDDKSITVKLQDGSSKIVLVSGSTSISEATQAGKQSLASGKQVMVFGSANSDGTVTAQNIQLNPQQGAAGSRNGAQ